MVPVIVAGPSAAPTLSSIYAAISETARFRPSIALVLEEESFARALECGADERCVAAELSAAGVELGILVVINTQLVPALLGLKILDTRARGVLAESVGQLPAEQISAELGARAAVLFERTGHGLAARLSVRVTPANAAITVDGLPSSAALFVAPGKHVIDATAPDHRPASASVEAIAGLETAVELALEKEEHLAESPWLWAGIALVLAGAATAMVVATRSTERYVCGPFDGVDCDPNR